MPLTPQEMRALYPITSRYAYLDHAAIAPLATPVRSTMEVFLGRMTEEPFDLAHWERFRGQVRGRVAELLSVGPESITFTKNTTSGLGMVAGGLDWEAGDNVVGVNREFPANIYPWMGLKRKGVELRLYRPEQGRIDVKALVRLCDARTRVLAISAVQFWSGLRTDLAALATALKGRPVLLVVDAMQAVGAMRLDISATPVDYLLERTKGVFVEQVIRPTGLMDPVVEVRPVSGQVDDLLKEIRDRASKNERVLVTTFVSRGLERVDIDFDVPGECEHSILQRQPLGAEHPSRRVKCLMEVVLGSRRVELGPEQLHRELPVHPPRRR